MRWGLRHSLIVPNWWHMRRPQTESDNNNDNNDNKNNESSRRQFQAAAILAVSAFLFAGLVLIRWWRISDRTDVCGGWTLADTWARVMAVSTTAQSADDTVDDLLALLATVWGMLNALVLTGVVFDLDVRTEWRPVFERMADVLLAPSVNSTRIQYSTISAELENGTLGAFCIDDDLPWDYEGLSGLLHANNGCAIYRILRDPCCTYLGFEVRGP